ncbi:hypothetical protein [Klebsiella grimontii]|uniref:hypothetical protein n=1 Tax=Klebsiella grimontii TaxID=2058152 RepID=UPI00163D79ED|nr:hypothetical protein [Klebsiella grimontii]MCS0528937.1 hypothetical protein [Klebsiella grimontii]
MTTPTVKPVLLSIEQIEKLRALQEKERNKSPLGIAPTIHVIARQLMDNALRTQMEA